MPLSNERKVWQALTQQHQQSLIQPGQVNPFKLIPTGYKSSNLPTEAHSGSGWHFWRTPLAFKDTFKNFTIVIGADTCKGRLQMEGFYIGIIDDDHRRFFWLLQISWHKKLQFTVGHERRNYRSWFLFCSDQPESGIVANVTTRRWLRVNRRIRWNVQG